ncbi:hypothetical protein RRG08_062306 [Elysia crispata]|uniref:Uncharacterized protein n=1 Tax=Elysia crispata TaxID=231223 RepID=A0AAE0YG45_9GAST|nr:hypothetical protein RRG08_062306 [Elysia crispata]
MIELEEQRETKEKVRWSDTELSPVFPCKLTKLKKFNRHEEQIRKLTNTKEKGNYGCAFLKNTVNISPSSKNPLGDIPCTDVESKLLLPKPPVSDLDLDVPEPQTELGRRPILKLDLEQYGMYLSPYLCSSERRGAPRSWLSLEREIRYTPRRSSGLHGDVKISAAVTINLKLESYVRFFGKIEVSL